MPDPSEVERLRRAFLDTCTPWVTLDKSTSDLDALLAAVRAEERERCAKIVDEWAEDEPTCCKREQARIAAALRALDAEGGGG